jgi:hypothetical protein
MSKESVYKEALIKVRELLDEHIKDLDLVFPPVPIMKAKDLIIEALKEEEDVYCKSCGNAWCTCDE